MAVSLKYYLLNYNILNISKLDIMVGNTYFGYKLFRFRDWG